jgi:3-methyladenine DNA glycosylase AlkC
MAEPLKSYVNEAVVRRIAALIRVVLPSFDEAVFIRLAVDGLEELELIPRAKHITVCLKQALPQDPEEAISILVQAVTSEHSPGRLPGMESFFYYPFVHFVAQYGLGCFQTSLGALHELTRLFTSEFGIRPFLSHYPEATLTELHVWATDPNEHVRRLVSEGTRPRLPWALRLPRFQEDPGPVLDLLEKLKDDPSEYVRRSVANNLNDISKDHPELVLKVTSAWWNDGDNTRRKLVKHALRTQIKAGNPQALSILGYGSHSAIQVSSLSCTPQLVSIGGKVQIEVLLKNPTEGEAAGLIDLRIHFVKSNGFRSAKVFKGKEVVLAPEATTSFKRTISVAQQTTRTHYPGEHLVEVVINGQVVISSSFIVG